MGLGWGIFLLLGLSTNAYAAETDPYDCRDWIALFDLQEKLVGMRQRQLPVSEAAKRRIASLSEALMREPAEDEDEEIPDFLKNSDYNDDDQEAEAQARAEEQDKRVEEQYFSWDDKLLALENRLSEAKDENFSHEATNAVFRRMVASRLFKNRSLRFQLESQGVMEESQQVLALECWVHNLSRSEAHLPDPLELKTFAKLLQLPSAEVLRMLDNLSLNEERAHKNPLVQAIYDTLIPIAVGRLNLPPQKLVAALQQTFAEEKYHPVGTFGKLLNTFLGRRDELYSIHDSDSLERYLTSH